MAKYRRPTAISTTPQGEFKFLPQVEIFMAADEVALQTAMNLWFTDRIPIPDITFHILSVNYIVDNPAKQYAMVWYLEAEVD